MSNKKTIIFLLSIIFFGTVGPMESDDDYAPIRKNCCSRVTEFFLNRSLVVSPLMGSFAGMSLDESHSDPALAVRNVLCCSLFSFSMMEFWKAKQIEDELKKYKHNMASESMHG